MKKDKRLIPKGLYCYSRIKATGIKGLCPYWSIRRGKPKQSNGYCAYLEKGDWDLNREVKWEQTYNKKNGIRQRKGKTMTAEEIGIPMSLIWDQCKECGIKDVLPIAEQREIDSLGLKDAMHVQKI